MSFYEDYISNGSACMACMNFFFDDQEPGYPRKCEDCVAGVEEDVIDFTGVTEGDR